QAGENKFNLSLIDLWASINNIDITESIEQVLSFINVKYKNSDFIRKQQEKYSFNTSVLGDLEYIQDNFPFLHKYMKRYELEIRALMDYAEANLYGDEYSHNGQAVFYISKRYAAKTIADYKMNSTINTKRTNTTINLLSLLGILDRVPSDDLSKKINVKTERLEQDGRKISFYSFNRFDDYTLSVANSRSEKLKDSNFKVSAMTKDYVISVLGEVIAKKVYNDNRVKSKHYKSYLTLYAKVINEAVQSNGYTTRKEAVDNIKIAVSRKNKEYHFDKVINDICNTYNLSFVPANKEIRSKHNIEGRGRKKVIIPNDL